VRRFGVASVGDVETLARVHAEIPEDPEDADDTETEVPVSLSSPFVVVGEHGVPSDEASDRLHLLEI
jgi:hypothetical protein